MSVNDLAKIEFYVSNRHRSINDGPLDWIVTFPQGLNEISSSSFFLQVDSVFFVNRIPTIMQSVNDTFTYEYSVGNGTVTRYSLIFSQGNYDINDVMNLLLTELRQRNNAFNLVFDSKQQLLSLYIPPNVNFTLVRPLYDPRTQANYAYNNANDRMLELLGWSFNNATYLKLAGGNSGYTWTPPCAVRLDGTMHIHLNVSSSISAFTSGSKGYRPIGCFPVTAGFGNLVTSLNTLQSVFEIRATDIQQGLHFFVTDEWGVNLSPFVDINTPFHVRFSLRPPL